MNVIHQSLGYCLGTYPVGTKIGSEELQTIHETVTSLAAGVGVKVSSLVGDGDSRLRKLQRLQHKRTNGAPLSTSLDWLSKGTLIEFPFVYGLGIKLKQLPMQDILHAIKKMRNNMEYLTTRLVLFCDPSKVTFEERYKYVVRWDLIFEIFKKNQLFQEKVPKSAILLTDKQDPSAVSDIVFHYARVFMIRVFMVQVFGWSSST